VNTGKAAAGFLVFAQVPNVTTARAAIFAALVFAAVKAFFLLFFAKVIHRCFCVWGCGGSLWHCGVFAVAVAVAYERAFSIRDQK
jgi:hypothetical protein